jgi:hypothetical protein
MEYKGGCLHFSFDSRLWRWRVLVVSFVLVGLVSHEHRVENVLMNGRGYRPSLVVQLGPHIFLVLYMPTTCVFVLHLVSSQSSLEQTKEVNEAAMGHKRIPTY